MYFLPTCVVLCCRGVAALVVRTILVIRSFREVGFALQGERVQVTDSRGSSWTWCVCVLRAERCAHRAWCTLTRSPGAPGRADAHATRVLCDNFFRVGNVCSQGRCASVRDTVGDNDHFATTKTQKIKKKSYTRELRVSVSSAFGRSLGAKSSSSAVAFLTRASLSPVARRLGAFCTWALAAASSAGSAPKGVVRRR